MKTPAQNAMNFVALDFETANASRASACAWHAVTDWAHGDQQPHLPAREPELDEEPGDSRQHQPSDD